MLKKFPEKLETRDKVRIFNMLKKERIKVMSMTAIAQLELVRNEKESAVDFLLEGINAQKKEALEKLFKGEDLKITYSEVALLVTEDSYTSERASIRFTSYYGEELAGSFSAYSSNSVETSIKVGQFAQLCEEVSEEAIKAIKAIDEKNKPALLALQAESRDLNRAIRELKQAEAEKAKAKEMEQLKSNEGLSFDLPEDLWRQPELQLRFDWSIRGITNLKVLGETATGKSLKVKITQQFQGWENNETVTKTQVRQETVRKSNVEAFLEEAKKYVTAE